MVPPDYWLPEATEGHTETTFLQGTTEALLEVHAQLIHLLWIHFI